MLTYLSLGIICSSELAVFLELHSRKTARFSEQITSTDTYRWIISLQMEAIVDMSYLGNSDLLFFPMKQQLVIDMLSQSDDVILQHLSKLCLFLQLV